MEKQGFEEKVELKSKLESTMEEKFLLEEVRKYVFELFSSSSMFLHQHVLCFPSKLGAFEAVALTVTTFFSIISSNL